MTMTKKEFQSEQSRASILAATMDLVSKHGFNGTSVDKIASQSGLSKGSIFWHFSNKATLFGAVISEIRDTLLNGLVKGFRDDQSIKEKIELLLDNYCGLIEADCSRCIDLTVLIIEMAETNVELSDELRDLFAAVTDNMIFLLEEGKKRGELDDSIDSRMTAYTVAGNLQGMTVQYYLNRPNLEYSGLMDAYKKILLGGLFRS